MLDDMPTREELIAAWMDVTVATELAERLASAAARSADVAERDAEAAERVAVLAEAASRAAEAAATCARQTADRLHAAAKVARDQHTDLAPDEATSGPTQ